MSSACPHCGHTFSTRDAKPGMYKPKCPSCGQRFELRVFDTPQKVPHVSVISSSTKAKRNGVGAAILATVSPPLSDVALPPVATSTNTADGGEVVNGFDLPSDEPIRSNQTPLRTVPAKISLQIYGYQIIRELGSGAMGAVYLGRQVSLNRKVAIKTIRPQYAKNPTFIARFIREAYAAAQLSHHNLVPIYELSQSRGIHYFTMEFVDGTSLDNIVKRVGKLASEVAVGYILQAARGLEFAHKRGMIHRDVKPGNLLVSRDGVLKVTDLGLVKTPELGQQIDRADARNDAEIADANFGGNTRPGEMTRVSVAMGTPLYMAPEQAEDAAGVDHRADIYSLGCTLYALITGRPPFQGGSEAEVIEKHQRQAAVRPDALDRSISPALSEITLRMMAKKPGDRFDDMGCVIQALENFLEVHGAGPIVLGDAHANTLEDSLKRFNSVPALRLRKQVPLGILVFCWIAGLLMYLAGDYEWSTAAAVMPFLAGGIYLGIHAIDENAPLLARLKQWVAMTQWIDRIVFFAIGLVLLLTIAIVGLNWIWIAIALLPTGIALAYHHLVDARLLMQRGPALLQAEELLKVCRSKGVEEPTLRQFAAGIGTRDWEEFFETLFGYDAKIVARDEREGIEIGRRRPKFRSWRDGFIRYVDRRVEFRRKLQERRYLQRLEEMNLQSQGIDRALARRQALLLVEELIHPEKGSSPEPITPTEVLEPSKPLSAEEAFLAGIQPLAEADSFSSEPISTLAAIDDEQTPTVQNSVPHGKRKEPRGKKLADKPTRVKPNPKETWEGTSSLRPQEPSIAPYMILLGPEVRFALGCMLFAGCAIWAYENGYFSEMNVEKIRVAANAAVDSFGNQDPKGAIAHFTSLRLDGQNEPLSAPLIGRLFNSINPGIAGLMLLFLGTTSGWRMSLFALPAAVIIFLGPHLGIGFLGEDHEVQATCIGIGLVISFVGYLFGRGEEAW